MKLPTLLAVALIAGCSSTQPSKPLEQKLAEFDITKTKLSVSTHAGNKQAADYATKNGHPERAAWWLAIDGLLTANEQQANACAAAIQAALPKKPDLPDDVSPELALEMAAEAVGNFSGIPASVKVTCEPLPIPRLPALPKL